MLFYGYVNVAFYLFGRLFTALFVRKSTFATHFCDVSSVCFYIFYRNAVFLRFQALLFSSAPALHLPFATPSATKNSADGPSEPIRAVPLYGLESYFFV